MQRQKRILLDHGIKNKRMAGLFLDRDGVVIEEKHFISNPDKVVLCRCARELIIRAKEENMAVVIVTNQSGITRGFYDWCDYNRVTDRMLELLGKEAQPNAIYANGYGPTNEPENYWRKPNPGMLYEAANDLNIQLQTSVMIGDRMSDLQAGINANVYLCIHVLTGHGKREREMVKALMNSKTGEEAPTAMRLVKDLNDLVGKPTWLAPGNE